MTPETTPNERLVLKSILEDDFQDSDNPICYPIWSSDLHVPELTAQQVAGVLGSLEKKGLAGFAEATVWITQAGWDALTPPKAMTQTQTLDFATEIYNQLGGNKFRAMTGAHTFAKDTKNKALHFRIGKGAAKGINLVSIRLNSMDLYDMKFLKVRGTDLKTVSTFEGLFFDQLQEIFTQETGFDTSL